MKEPGYFSIMVSNDGHPIPHDMQEKIFQPFVQIKQTSGGQRTAGTGIGLPLARSLAELHKGKLYLKDSEEICFCVELPVDQEKAIQLQKDSTISQTGNMQTAIRQHSTNICILVVEDDPEMQNFICAQLETVYCVIRASNGKEALQVLSEKTISLIVSDVMMPEMDGIEMCRRIKNNLSVAYIPLVLLTAKDNVESQIEGYESGADLYIPKPFSMKLLEVNLQRLLAQREQWFKSSQSALHNESASNERNTGGETGKEPQKSALNPEELKAMTEQLKKVIDENLGNPDLSPEQIANAMGVSRTKLYRDLKRIDGQSLSDYVRNVRLEKAAFLLVNTELNVQEIMNEVGFANSSHFTKIFKLKYDMPPTEYKKSH